MTSDEERAEWQEWPVCSLQSVAVNSALGFIAGDGDWPFRGFVLRRGDSIYAYANICPHRQHPLDSMPDQFLVEDGRLIRCGSHGALFTSETGECVFGPCVGGQLMRLPVRVDEQGKVFVRCPDNLQDAISLAQTRL